jgi:hypothetical protein
MRNLRNTSIKELRPFNVATWKKPSKVTPNNAKNYNNRAISYFFRKDFKNAWQDVKKCQALGGQVNPEFLEQLKKASKKQ